MNAFNSKLRLRPFRGIPALALALSVAAAALPANASTFRLQSNTIILEEREGRVSFSVDNPGSEPLLLLSKLENLEDNTMAGNVLVTPAVTRIDPGQSQVVNFVLKKGITLDREYMLKASFEGVTQKSDRGMRMPIRQQIGFILQPKSLALTPNPAQNLRFSINGNTLTVTNSGKQVVRMGPALTLRPSGVTASLPHPYIMPGQSVEATFEAPVQAQSVEIVPLSRFGFANETVQLPLSP